MNNKRKFWFIFLITIVVWYIIIGFVTWELDWVKHLSDMSTTNRLWFVLGVVVKIIIDRLIWSFIKEKPRKEEDQSNYIYEEK